MGTDSRWTLAGPARWEQEIRKSRFLALAERVADASQALAFIDASRVADARHHCWAWQIGSDYRFHDDGEPGGTAGRPILQAIQGQGFDEVVVLVIRWFGGIKLGTGGLARAYGGTAAQCLHQADKIALIESRHLQCHCPFSDIGRVQARFAEHGVEVQAETFDGDGVQWTLSLPQAAVDGFVEQFLNLTRGQGVYELDDPAGIND